VKAPETAVRLVFTDLDGSLLDHHSYSFQDALPQLHKLEQLNIPVIAASSKTRREIEQLRRELDNGHPFIVENGAAVFIPRGYVDHQPAGTIACEDYWVHELSQTRAEWLAVLGELRREFAGEFDNFFRAGTPGIARMTGLPESQAALANQREYSEPVLWQGSEERRREFVAALRVRGATALQGGRFLGVSGDCDKGRALRWLREVYLQAMPGRSCQDLAIGDSGNDRAMLEAAGTALLIRSPVHDFPALTRDRGVIRSTRYGPAGWAEGVELWLRDLLHPNNS
jgi:mannosyl-3-phosphoglycerate phosphatase